MSRSAVDDLLRAAEECEAASAVFHTEPVSEICRRLNNAATELSDASSESWLGYHAYIYTVGLRGRRPGEHFDSEWGGIPARSSRMTGEWQEYTYEEILEEIRRRAGRPDEALIEQAAKSAGAVFESYKEDAIPTLDAVLSLHKDDALRDLRKEIDELDGHTSCADFVRAIQPRGQFMSRDTMAVTQGLRAPHHLVFMSWLLEQQSFGRQCEALAKLCRRAARYIQKRFEMPVVNVKQDKKGKVFIGHGKSLLWRVLKDFLQDTLRIEWDEYQRESTAGLSRKERLEHMLGQACFAFLVMTGDDEHADSTMHARENVIHEAGLFQGRLGFTRAIILLEDGCAEFSNVHGLDQIRFPKGQIEGAFEEIRRVLEREKIL